MKYKTTVRVTVITIALATTLRILQKLFLISPETGFFTDLDITIYMLFAIILGGTIVAVLPHYHEKFRPLGKLRCRVLAVLSVASAAAIAADTYTWANYIPELPPLVPVPDWISTVLLVTGGLSVAVMLIFAINYISKSDMSSILICSVVLPVWMAVRTITRFGYFSQVTTVSDNLLESCFMMAACLFFTSHSYTIAGFEKRSFRTLITAITTVTIGIPLSIGQIVGVLQFGDNGITLQIALLTLCISTYAMVFTHHVLKRAVHE